MGRKRDRASGFGLLPRMEARPWSDGKTVSYRYHPVDGKPIALGTDKRAAIQKVLDLNGASSDTGTVSELWRTYQATPQWKRLGERTKADYEAYSVKLLEVMGKVSARLIRPADIARYLRVERSAAPVRGNREVALLSNLMNVAVERGDIDVNPCKQVKRIMWSSSLCEAALQELRHSGSVEGIALRITTITAPLPAYGDGRLLR